MWILQRKSSYFTTK